MAKKIKSNNKKSEVKVKKSPSLKKGRTIKVELKKPVQKVGKTAKKTVKKGAGGILGLLKAIAALPRTIFRFLKSVGHELKLVQWLSRKQTARWSSAVILTTLAFGGLLALSDYLYFLFRDLLFKKL